MKFLFLDEFAEILRENAVLKGFIDRLEKTNKACEMEVGPDRIQMRSNNPNQSELGVRLNGYRFQTVKSFNNLGSIISDEGSDSIQPVHFTSFQFNPLTLQVIGASSIILFIYILFYLRLPYVARRSSL